MQRASGLYMVTRADLQMILQLGLALLLAGVLGWERERLNRAAGLRTHMLVGMSATLFAALGMSLVEHYERVHESSPGLVALDPTRLIEAVVAGVSFLGAGTIFVSRRGGVQGLTTAASILATAGVGVAIAFERYVVAVCATIMVFVVLTVIRWLEPAGGSPVRSSDASEEEAVAEEAVAEEAVPEEQASRQPAASHPPVRP
jgi:putative Mg2+ transporter-C (MgtC) family protein